MKIAIIGAGAIARRAHLPAWKGISGADVFCVADLDENAAKKAAEEFGIRRFTQNIDDVLGDSKIDILDLCTPTPTHHKLMLAAIDSGKHILCEKPLSNRLEESIDIYNNYTKRNRGKKLSLIYNWRYQDNIRSKLMRRMQKKPFGELLTVHGRAFSRVPVGWTPSMWLYHEAAVLYDFTPHLIDAVQWLVDKPVDTVYCQGKNFTENANFLSSAQIIIKYENGPTALLDTSWDINSSQFNIDLFGDCAHVHIDMKRDRFSEFHGALTILDEIREFINKMANIGKGIIEKNISTKPLLAYLPLFNDFIRSIDRGSGVPMPIEKEIWVSAILEAAKSSIESGEPIILEELFEKSPGFIEQSLSRYSKASCNLP